MAAFSKTKPARSAAAYFLAAGLGLGAGALNLKLADLLLTALCVLCFTMLLGAMYPERPWRWTLLIAGCVPLVQIAALLRSGERQPPAQIYESLLGFVTGFAGAYGGAVARRVVMELQAHRRQEPEGPREKSRPE